MENLPNPDQLRLYGSKINSEHHFLHPKVVELPQRHAENTGHDDFIDSTERQIEFHERELYEGEQRTPPMPEVQQEAHREQLEIHHNVLKSLLGKVIEFPTKEEPEDLVA